MSMKLDWQQICRLLGQDVVDHLEEVHGVSCLNDFSCFWASGEEINCHFHRRDGWRNNEADLVFKVWQAAKASLKGDLGSSAVLLRRAWQVAARPAVEPVISSVTLSAARKGGPPVSTLLSASASASSSTVDRPTISSSSAGLPLHCKMEKVKRPSLMLNSRSSGSSAAKRAKVRDDFRPVVSESRGVLLDEIFALYVSAGPSGDAWIPDASDPLRREFIRRSISSFDDGVLRRELGILKKFREFVTISFPDEVFLHPSVATVFSFLQASDLRGTTVAKGMYYALNWWTAHLGFNFHCAHGAVEKYASFREDHKKSQAEVMDSAIAIRLIQLILSSSASVTGTVTMVLRGILLCIACSLRYKHFRISEFSHEDANFIYFHCPRGKRREQGTRQGFDWAVQRFVIPGRDLFGPLVPLYRRLESMELGWKCCPLPDVSSQNRLELRNDDAFLCRSMAPAKFVRCLQGVLCATGASYLHPRGLTTYCLRRFVITLALALRFNDDDLDAVGNWVERIKTGPDSASKRASFAMHTHYAGSKTQTAANIRASAIRALWSAYVKCARDTISISEVMAAGAQMDEIWHSLAEGPGENEHPVLTPEPAVAIENLEIATGKPGKKTSSSSSSDSDSGAGVNEATSRVSDQGATEDLQVNWFQQKTVLHLCSDESETLVALCNATGYAREPLCSGASLRAALETAAPWCRGCLRRLTPDKLQRLEECQARFLSSGNDGSFGGRP